MENMKKTARAVNVRTLAETYYEAGDLFADLNRIDRMQEGLKGHLMVQSAYAREYHAEVPVRMECNVAGVDLIVQGRVDGLILTEDACTVEEIKTTRLPPESIKDTDYPVHWAQAEIYAYIVTAKNDLPAATVRLVYASLTGAKASFTRLYTREKLTSLFYMYASVYAKRVSLMDSWKSESVPTMKALSFPFETYRAGQREMASRAYIAIRDKKKILIEAPTGIGKTAAALFPAIKALGEGMAETVFYLTARTTGRASAENALMHMRKSGLSVRSVTITAKKKACPMQELKCDPNICPNARGYFDRQRDAINESYASEHWGADEIQILSEKHSLCPFELSLALSETADVVICDYNYVFDPAVRLRRFFDRKGAYILLIDEVHNLIPRAREMYSESLGDKEISDIRREVGREDGRKSPLYLALTRLYHALPKDAENELSGEMPEKFLECVKSFIEEAKPFLSSPSMYKSKLADLFFKANGFVRASNDFDENTHRTLITPEGKRSRIKIWCWNPTYRLASAMKRMRGSVLFSATLSPIRHYAGLLSLNTDAGDSFMQLPSPFPKENLLSVSLPIPTRYRAREESAHRVAKAIYEMARAKTGNYLACFPSHAYLNAVAEIFMTLYPDVRVSLQTRDMTEDERQAYLSEFEENPSSSMVAFIAMGGVFSEGVDLPGDKLIGAAIVGVGLPQISYENDCLKELYEETMGNGFETAYVYPGAGKCLQAAGRVIRTETDRGVVLFIDERYRSPEYKNLLQPRYTPRMIQDQKLYQTLNDFWSEV